VSEVAFASEVTEKGNKFVYLEMHVLEMTGYVIKNFYLKSSGEGYIEQPLPENVAEKFITNSFVPLFALVSPNIVNNFEDCNGLGMAVFANAIDQIIGVDLAFHNFNRDLKLGGKKVFYSEDLVQKDGAGNIITPDDVCQQLFTILKKDEIGALDGKTDWHEYNPDLRVQANKEAVQSQLDYLSFKCGFGTKHYQFNAGSIVTATQYAGDKQELVQNASKHYIVIERALRAVTKAILWAGDKLSDGTKIDIVFDDSIIIDKETERLRDIGEVNAGLKAKWEFRVKWYGETETVAKKMADEIDSASAPTGVI
jgi:A118 family predicted phage portal protein